MSYNPGLLFYKHYYEKIQFGSDSERVAKDNKAKFETQNNILKSIKFSKELLPLLPASKDSHSFLLTTTYPGLILGTGYTHGSGLEGEFKTGFYFDHTTGFPVIPGSSVKGLLRSTFPGLYFEKAEDFRRKNKDADADFWEKLGKNRERFIHAILEALGYQTPDNRIDIGLLERETFEGLYLTDREKAAHHFPMHYRDIFFDAVITDSKDGFIFNDDYITPHKNPLKNPIPIQILKVRPEITFTFQFRLQDAYRLKNEGNDFPRVLNSIQRLELFRQILMFLGAGAKTNTGYGQFVPVNQVSLMVQKSETPNNEDKEEVNLTPDETPQPDETPPPKKYPNLKYDKKLSGNVNLVGKLLRKEGNTAFFQLVNVEGYEQEVQATNGSVPKLEVGRNYPLKAGNVVPKLQVTIIGFNAI